MPFTGPAVFTTTTTAIDRRTFGDCKRELALPFSPDDETTLAIAGDSFNSALRAYNRFLWPWEILTQNITISSGVEVYSLDRPFKKPLSFYYTDANGRRIRRIHWQPYDSFILEYGLKSDGSPQLYTMRNEFETGTLLVYPRPISADTAQLDYYRSTPTMQRDEMPVEAPEYALEAIMQWAWFEMYKRMPGQERKIGQARLDAASARAELVGLCAARGDNTGPQ